MSRPRLLVMTSTLPRWPGDTEPAFVESLSFELAEQYDVTVLAPHARGTARDEVLTNNGRTIRVHRFRYAPERFESLAYEGGIMARLRQRRLRILLVPLFIIAELLALVRLNRRERFDAMHAHWIIPQGLVAAAYHAVSGAAPPFLVTAHGSDLHGLRGVLMARLKRWVLRRAGAVSVVAAPMLEAAEALGCPVDKLTVRSMGVDLHSTFTPGDDPRDGLVFVGRLVDVKGVPQLLDAMALLAPDRPELRLRIIGDGPERGAIEQRIGALGLGDVVQLEGSRTADEVADALRGARALVMPSVVTPGGAQEGFGLVAVEAMGCGCPVIASDLPGIRDAVEDEVTGLLATPGDAAAFAAKIGVLLDDTSLGEKLAGNARQYALEHFDWPRVGQDYSRLIAGVIRSG